MKKILVLSIVLLPLLSYSQTCNCDSLFSQTKKLVEENYAGWFDKITTNNQKSYADWTSQKQLEVRSITNDSACAKKLQEWIGFFKDKHLRILYSKPSNTSSQTQSDAAPVEILKHSMTPQLAETYFKDRKKLDPIEGIYSNSNYKLGIVKVKPTLFYAVVLTTQNENWTPGEVKLVIEKKGGVYKGTFYEGDKTGTSTHPVKLVDNILDFDIVCFEKQTPNVTTKRDLTEYEISKDKDAPSLHFKGAVAIWSFPTFYSNSEEQTAFLLNKYKTKLSETPYWIIDLRNNAGGDYTVGMQLMPYIYSKPFLKYHSEMRLTPLNIELWFKSFVKSYYDQADEKTKKDIDDELALMRSKIGSMYNSHNKLYDTIQMQAKTVNPKKIALLINENTLSSGELFTMLASQSDKVIVMGAPSTGMMDYGNILRHRTSYPTIRVQIPSDRMLWLNTGFSVDKEGLQPTIKLTGNNWIEEAIETIKNRQ